MVKSSSDEVEPTGWTLEGTRGQEPQNGVFFFFRAFWKKQVLRK